MYECCICYSLNHSSRIHCQTCGTIPAMYSVTGKPMVWTDGEAINYQREVVAAIGCVRSSQHYQARYKLETKELTYYALD